MQLFIDEKEFRDIDSTDVSFEPNNPLSKFSVLKLIEFLLNCATVTVHQFFCILFYLWVYYTIPFGFSLF